MNKRDLISFMLVLICFVLSSCIRKPYTQILTDGSLRYWHYVGSSKSKEKYADYGRRQDSTYWYFDNRGTFMMFHGKFHNFGEFYTLALVFSYDPFWKRIDDENIKIGFFYYKVLECTDKRILLQQKGHDMVVDTLEAVGTEKIPVKYRKYQKPLQFEEYKKKNIFICEQKSRK